VTVRILRATAATQPLAIEMASMNQPDLRICRRASFSRSVGCVYGKRSETLKVILFGKTRPALGPTSGLSRYDPEPVGRPHKFAGRAGHER